MKDVIAIILAAGKGERMNSDLPKVLQALSDKPLVRYILDSLKEIKVSRIIVVVGYNRDLVIKQLSRKEEIVTQKRLSGTADALKATQARLKNYQGIVLVMAGDAPLIKAVTLKKLIKLHKDSNSAATILSSIVGNPSGYGRVLRHNNRVVKIIEESQLDERSRDIREVNSGVYCFKARPLFENLSKVKLNPQKKEYYLTDIIEIMASGGEVINTLVLRGDEEILGINTRHDLSRAADILNRRMLDKLMDEGVTIIDPKTTYIGDNVKVGPDAVIFPFTVIEKNVIIGKNCRIGPFCHLRKDTKINDGATVGNFVEVVRSEIGRFSKVKHLSYIGDTYMGEEVNVGAGTVVANFDGKKKNRTLIENKAFIGSGSIIIAPVKIGKKATTGAGAVVTHNKNVPMGKTVVGVPARILKK